MWSQFSFRRWVGRLRAARGEWTGRRVVRLRLRVEGLEDRSVPAGLDPQVTLAARQDFAGPMARAGYDLAYLYHEYLAFTSAVGPQLTAFRSADPLLQVSGGTVVVDVLPTATTAATTADLTPFGFQLTGRSAYVISGALPIAALSAVAGLPSVRAIQPGYKPITSAGSVLSQGAQAIHSDGVNQFLGVDGTGVTVGVLSDSYDSLGGAAGDVAGGDLPGGGNPNGRPTPVNVLDDSTGGSDEGRAMLQVVHDVAPGANLAFATAGTTQSQFAANIRRLATEGAADVLVDDFTFLTEPMFQDGLVAQAVDEVVGLGVSYFSAAGNLGRASYQQAFRGSGTDLVGTGAYTVPAALAPQFVAHDFDPGAGTDTFQTVTLPPGTTSFSFQWADPFFSVSGGAGAQTDLDVAVFDTDGNFLNLGGFTRNVGGDPIEVFSITNPNGTPLRVQLAIGKVSGPDPSLLKYVAFRPGTSDGVTIDEFATDSSTTFGHANAAGASTVGAALYSETPAFGQTPALLQPYSSRGGTPILYGTDGALLGQPQLRQTPDIVAPDGVNTTFFGQADAVGTGGVEGDGAPNFFGTSAAAPHAAGVAALLLQVRPGMAPGQLYSTLESTALDMGPAGYDRDSGWGLIQAPAAVAAVGGPFAVTYTGTDDADDLRISRDPSGQNIDFFLGGVLRLRFPVAEITSITMLGKGGGDTLTVDVTNGAIGRPVAFDGGDGGDTLVVVGDAFPDGVTAAANTAPVPTVTLTSGNSPPLAITSVETAALTPGNGAVALVGDDNTGTDQEDVFVVRGTGPGAFTAALNGSPAIHFAGVTALAVSGGGLADTFDVSPWASNSPAGWGVQTSYAGGSGPGANLLVYTAVAANPVSESVVVQPAGSGGGEVRVTGAADGSAIAVISYTNTDLVVNNDDGYGTDTDTLTLRGTAFEDEFRIDLTAAGTAAAPVVRATALGTGFPLYNLRSFTGFDSFRVETLGGPDTVELVAGLPDASISVDADLGAPVGGVPETGDRVVVYGTDGAADLYRYTPGATAAAARVEVTRAGAAAPTVLTFAGAEAVTFDGGAPGSAAPSGTDQLVLDGTGGDDGFALGGSVSGGVAQVNAGPLLALVTHAPGRFALTLDGLGGDDTFAIAQPGSGNFNGVAIDGGGGSDAVTVTGTPGDDEFTYTPSTGALVVGTPVPVGYALTGVESVRVDGLGHGTGDRLVVTEPLAYTPTPGSGTLPTAPPLAYQNVELFTIDQLPAAAPDAAATVEDTAVVIDVLGNDTGIGDGPLTLEVVAGPGRGTAVVVGGQIRYTPAPNANTVPGIPDAFTYRVTDVNGESATATVTVAVAARNDAPTATAQTVFVPEDAMVPVTLAGADGDPEVFQSLTFAIVSPPSHGTLVGFDPATGTVSYVPAADYNGPDAFAFTVTDDDTAGGPARTSSPAIVSVTVTPVNDPPTAAGQSVTTAEDGSVALTLAGADGDAEVAQALTFVITTPPLHGALSGFDPFTGRVTYTPAANYSGPDSFAFAVVDDITAGGGALYSPPAVVSVTVTPTNDPPVAFAQGAAVAEDGSVTLTLAGADGDPEATQGLTFVLVSGPAHGSVTAFDPATGQVTYAPAPDYFGPDSFTFAVTDDATLGGPALTSAPAAVSVTVFPTNDPPTAAGQSATVTADGSVVVTVTGDGGDPGTAQALTFAVATGPAHGTVVPLGGGRFRYTPTAGYTGPDGFAVVATDDGTLGPARSSAAALVAITVAPVPQVIAAGAGAGGGPHVVLFDGATGQPTFSFFAYDPAFTGGVRVATGDVNGDGVADVVTAPGPGGFPHIKVFSGKDLTLLASFFAFDAAFTGGTSVAVGNIDGLPGAEIVVGASPGAGPHVRTFQLVNGEIRQMPGPLGSFFAFDPAFTGGVNVAVGNYDGLPGDELVVGAASLGGPHVKVFGADGTTRASFFAFADSLLGVSVALGDVDGDGKAEIITGPGDGGGPVVRVFAGGTGVLRSEFPAFDPDFRGGVTVGAADRDGDGKADILVAPGQVARSAQVFDGETLELITRFDAFDADFPGGVYVAGS